jgi:cystathionine beta-lyase/cystathionine gamma-synthase
MYVIISNMSIGEDPPVDALHAGIGQHLLDHCDADIAVLHDAPEDVRATLLRLSNAVRKESISLLNPQLRELQVRVANEQHISSSVTRPFPNASGLFDAFMQEGEFYDRYGSDIVRRKECEYTQLTGADTAILNAGMSAIDAVLAQAALRAGDTIVAGQNFYGLTKNKIAALEQDGINVIRVDTGRTADVLETLRIHKPRMVILESIANAQSMEVADLDALFAAVKNQNDLSGKAPCRIVVDNTLLSPALLQLSTMWRNYWPEGSAPVMGIESATKYFQYGNDRVNAGIVYSDDAACMKDIRSERSSTGTHMPGTIVAQLPRLDADLWKRVLQRHSENALAIASILAEELGTGAVSYPGLPTHRDHAILQRLTGGNAGGLLYVNLGARDGGKIVDRIRELSSTTTMPVSIGGSFGHKGTWMFAFNMGTETEPQWQMRVAPGMESPSQLETLKGIICQTVRESI